jgi:hypothetical protein
VLSASQDDLLGLRRLDEAGKLEMKEIDGAHMQFTLEWFLNEVLHEYLV